MGLIGRQLNNTQFLKESYELASKQPFGHLLIDLDPKTLDVLRYCSNIVPPGPSIFYLLSPKAVIIKLRQMRQSSDLNLKKLIKTASKNFIEFFVNVVNGKVAINEKLIETHKKSVRKSFSKQTGLKKKKRILDREGELLQRIGLSRYF